VLEQYCNRTGSVPSYSLFGFGAKMNPPPPHTPLSGLHMDAAVRVDATTDFNNVTDCFPIYSVSGSRTQHFGGVEELLQAYGQAFPHFTLSGPTRFAPLIKHVHTHLMVPTQTSTNLLPWCSQQMQRYLVLLIITDGAIVDLKQTIQEIVTASESPMSIIIIGVGDEDLSGDTDQFIPWLVVIRLVCSNGGPRWRPQRLARGRG
jgi:hypothetical protein